MVTIKIIKNPQTAAVRSTGSEVLCFSWLIKNTQCNYYALCKRSGHQQPVALWNAHNAINNCRRRASLLCIYWCCNEWPCCRSNHFNSCAGSPHVSPFPPPFSLFIALNFVCQRNKRSHHSFCAFFLFCFGFFWVLKSFSYVFQSCTDEYHGCWQLF